MPPDLAYEKYRAGVLGLRPPPGPVEFDDQIYEPVRPLPEAGPATARYPPLPEVPQSEIIELGQQPQQQQQQLQSHQPGLVSPASDLQQQSQVPMSFGPRSHQPVRALHYPHQRTLVPTRIWEQLHRENMRLQISNKRMAESLRELAKAMERQRDEIRQKDVELEQSRQKERSEFEVTCLCSPRHECILMTEEAIQAITSFNPGQIMGENSLDQNLWAKQNSGMGSQTGWEDGLNPELSSEHNSGMSSQSGWDDSFHRELSNEQSLGMGSQTSWEDGFNQELSNKQSSGMGSQTGWVDSLNPGLSNKQSLGVNSQAVWEAGLNQDLSNEQILGMGSHTGGESASSVLL